MVEALAPRFSRWWLALTLLASFPALASAQAPKGEPAAKADDKVEEKKDDEKGVIDKQKADKQETTEVFEDPRAKALLDPKAFREFPPTKPALTQADYSAIKNAAAGVVGVNRDLMSRFIDQMAADLSKHENIKAVVDPDPKMPANAAQARAIEKASQTLMELISVAQGRKNGAFLDPFNLLLFAKFTPLLEGHLLTRIEATIVLASAATSKEVDLFIKQINDPKQVVWVKHWSAVALTNATNKGQVVLAVNDATAAAKALLGFLEKEPATPWPVKLRVLQALGSIHLGSTAGVNGKPDIAAYALTLAADPGARIELRAWAAWCLGMLNVAGGQAFNYKLAAYQLGALAAEIGDRIVADCDQRADKFTRQNQLARLLTGLLLYQVYPALAGEDGVSNSGLLHTVHPAATASRPFLTVLDDQLKKLGRAANNLLLAGGGQVKQSRDDLAAQVVELKSFLDKNRPAPNETELFPGGPKLTLPPSTSPAPAPASAAPKPAGVAGAARK